MDTQSTRYINQLVNAHKISLILVPLIEAIEINKRTAGVDDLSLDDLLKKVIDTGGDIYQDLLEGDTLLDVGLVSDKLFLTLSKSLRNNIVLYNSPSLSLIKEEMIDMMKEHSGFIQKYQNLAFVKDVGSEKLSKLEVRQAKQYSQSYIVGGLSQMFMPIWTFHTNLYTSNIIDEEKLTLLNMEASSYIVKAMDLILDKISMSQGAYSKEFSGTSVFLCAEMIANVLHDFNGKLIKNKSSLDAYLKDPESILSKLLPALYSNFRILNKSAENILSKSN